MYSYIKNACDRVAALTLLILAMPLLVVVALVIFVSDRGPVFFRQTRVGYKQNKFELLKFRTMVADKNRNYDLALDNAEITRVGMILRRLKVDELPQLLNVLKGDMSLVGPRPPLPSLLDDMSGEQVKRFNVLPGLTGLAQVNGNIHLDWQDRFEYDLFYVRNISFSLDVKIALKTILVVLFGEDKFKKKRPEV